MQDTGVLWQMKNGDRSLAIYNVLERITTLVKTSIPSSKDLEETLSHIQELKEIDRQYKKTIEHVTQELEITKKLFEAHALLVGNVLPQMMANREKATLFFHYYTANKFFTIKLKKESSRYEFNRDEFKRFITIKDEFSSIVPKELMRQCKCHFDEIDKLIKEAQALLKRHNIFERKAKKESLLIDILEKVSSTIRRISFYNFARLDQNTHPATSVGYETINCSEPPRIRKEVRTANFSYHTFLTTNSFHDANYPTTQLEAIKKATSSNELSMTVLMQNCEENSNLLRQEQGKLGIASKRFIEEAEEKHIIADIVNAIVCLQITQGNNLFNSEYIHELLEEFPGIKSDTVMQHIYTCYYKIAPKCSVSKQRRFAPNIQRKPFIPCR